MNAKQLKEMLEIPLLSVEVERYTEKKELTRLAITEFNRQRQFTFANLCEVWDIKNLPTEDLDKLVSYFKRELGIVE
jgi:hypothetical protein